MYTPGSVVLLASSLLGVSASAAFPGGSGFEVAEIVASQHALRIPVSDLTSLRTQGITDSFGASAQKGQEAPVVVMWNVANGLCADVPYFGKGKSGDLVTQFACRPDDDDNQQVRVVPVGKYGRFLLQVQKNGTGSGAMCYDVPGRGNVAKGTPVRLARCKAANDNQLFYARNYSLGTQLIHNATGMCLDVAGDRERRLGNSLLLWPCSRKDDHFWQLDIPARAPRHRLPSPPVNFSLNREGTSFEGSYQFDCPVPGKVSKYYNATGLCIVGLFKSWNRQGAHLNGKVEGYKYIRLAERKADGASNVSTVMYSGDTLSVSSGAVQLCRQRSVKWDECVAHSIGR